MNKSERRENWEEQFRDLVWEKIESDDKKVRTDPVTLDLGTLDAKNLWLNADKSIPCTNVEHPEVVRFKVAEKNEFKKSTKLPCNFDIRNLSSKPIMLLENGN